jgi:hypothetical protein
MLDKLDADILRLISLYLCKDRAILATNRAIYRAIWPIYLAIEVNDGQYHLIGHKNINALTWAARCIIMANYQDKGVILAAKLWPVDPIFRVFCKYRVNPLYWVGPRWKTIYNHVEDVIDKLDDIWAFFQDLVSIDAEWPICILLYLMQHYKKCKTHKFLYFNRMADYVLNKAPKYAIMLTIKLPEDFYTLERIAKLISEEQYDPDVLNSFIEIYNKYPCGPLKGLIAEQFGDQIISNSNVLLTRSASFISAKKDNEKHGNWLSRQPKIIIKDLFTIDQFIANRAQLGHNEALYLLHLAIKVANVGIVREIKAMIRPDMLNMARIVIYKATITSLSNIPYFMSAVDNIFAILDELYGQV